MKKTISLLLALVLCLSLCACGEKEDNKPTKATEPAPTTEPTVQLELGEPASTDIAEFTLDKSQFTLYVSNVSSNYVEPMDEPNELFNASIGHCYVSLTYTITNKDRGGSLDFAGTFGDWNPKFTVSYGGEEYPVKGFDLNNKDGDTFFTMAYSVVLDRNTGEILYRNDTGNVLISAGETVTYRSFGVIGIEPENLTDSYKLTVSVPNSKGEYERFTYTVPAR